MDSFWVVNQQMTVPVYWASNSPIPGGISFENFELKTPYRQGDSFVFGITPLSPEEFIREEDIR